MAGLMVPGVLLSLGLASLMRQLGIPPAWWYSGLGVHVVWTLPLDINAAMTQRVQPTIFALGTASTIFSLLMIGLFIVVYTILYRRSR
jgi:ABC-type spermidine/putrescine transport system permease subunit II